MQKILFIEDDVNLGLPVAGVLEEKGYTVRYLTSGATFMAELATFDPDLILLDVNLNEQLNGFEMAQQIRLTSDVPVIFTSSRVENNDFELGFGISNVDYVRKPYRIVELLRRMERMQSVLPKNVSPENFRIGAYTFYYAEYLLKFDAESIQLNHYEAKVLKELCNCYGQFIDRTELVEKVWNVNDPKLKDGSLNNVLSQLRKYMAADTSIQIESRAKLGVMLRTN